MENRLSLPEMVEDEFRRFSFTPSVMPQRGSVAILHPRRDLSPEPENVVDTPPPESPTFEPENVFATPTHSRSNSLSASMATMEYDGLSLRRSSLTLSEPRSLSPLPVADGGWGSYGGHRRSISLSRSVTPSMSVGTLRRSDTTNTQTTNASSTLYYSRTSGTPSSLQSVAVRPRFDYGGHQQTLSINGSELDDADPFDDGYVVPVSDGFAPRTQNLAPEAPGPSNAGTFGSLPPPYERYPEIAIGPTKGGEGEIDLGVREPDAFLPLAAAAIQLGDEGVRQRRDNGGAAGAVVVVAPIAGQDSGELKEWKGKKLATVRRWHIVLSGIVALLIGLAVGLGVGLGIGLNKGKELEYVDLFL